MSYTPGEIEGTENRDVSRLGSCVRSERERERERERQRDRETERQRDRETERGTILFNTTELMTR